MFNNLQNPLALVGRILLALIFVVSGFGKIGNFAGTAGYMASAGVPMAQVALVLTILVEFGAGLLLVLGFRAREAAAVIFLFLIPVTLVFHMGGDQMNQIQLMKNISIMGGMLLVVAFGPGAFSIDGRRGKA